MRPDPLRPYPLPLTPIPITVAPSSAPTVRYLSNSEAAEFLRLSPRTLEKQRVIGGGPRFRKFGRRVVYAMVDLEAWADARSFEMTSDPEYTEAAVVRTRHHAVSPRTTRKSSTASSGQRASAA